MEYEDFALNLHLYYIPYTAYTILCLWGILHWYRHVYKTSTFVNTMSDLGEKCGVFGVYGKGLDVARISFFGLFALQHRGQESSGIAASDGERIVAHKGMGLVSQVFSEDNIKELTGHIAIGHNRPS